MCARVCVLYSSTYKSFMYVQAKFSQTESNGRVPNFPALQLDTHSQGCSRSFFIACRAEAILKCRLLVHVHIGVRTSKSTASNMEHTDTTETSNKHLLPGELDPSNVLPHLPLILPSTDHPGEPCMSYRSPHTEDLYVVFKAIQTLKCKLYKIKYALNTI